MAPARLPALSRGTGPRPITSARGPAWLSAVVERVAQEPLLHTGASLASLRGARRRPRAVLVGVGLCNRRRLSTGLPLDVAGLILPAEQLRRAAGADELLLLVADRHALTNRLDPARVEQRARDTVELLRRMSRQCGLGARVIRASTFHDRRAYREVLAEIRRRLPGAHEYVQRQLADCIHFDQLRGGILKVGWTAGRPAAADEVAFDRRLRGCYDGPISFAYCKPGRTLDGAAVPPYVSADPDRRICLDAGEDPAGKLADAGDDRGHRACRRHLKAIAYTYARHVAPLRRGPLEHRLEALISALLDPRAPSPRRAA